MNSIDSDRCQIRDFDRFYVRVSTDKLVDEICAVVGQTIVPSGVYVGNAEIWMTWASDPNDPETVYEKVYPR